MGEPAAKKFCTTTLGAVKRVAIEGNIGMALKLYYDIIKFLISERPPYVYMCVHTC